MPDDFIFDGQTTTWAAPSVAGTETIITSSNTGWIELYHGSDLVTAGWMVRNGIDFEMMKRYYPHCSGAFWTSTRQEIAEIYAGINVAVQMQAATPALFSFKLPRSLVTDLMTSDPPLAGQELTDSAYYFLPSCFPVVTATMVDRKITQLADLEFDEE